LIESINDITNTVLDNYFKNNITAIQQHNSHISDIRMQINNIKSSTAKRDEKGNFINLEIQKDLDKLEFAIRKHERHVFELESHKALVNASTYLARNFPK